MTKRQSILAQIEELKANKPEDWKRTARKLLWELHCLEDPFWDMEDRGTEARGRHAVNWSKGPRRDNMDDESYP